MTGGLQFEVQLDNFFALVSDWASVDSNLPLVYSAKVELRLVLYIMMNFLGGIQTRNLV